jgi:restriction system protein
MRVWPEKADRQLPPALLVQCKRERKKIGKVVVKALWADVLAERAGSGLIVTTTALSPGAKKVCTARAYRIREADRGTLREWIEAMKTPDRGIFLGE